MRQATRADRIVDSTFGGARLEDEDTGYSRKRGVSTSIPCRAFMRALHGAVPGSFWFRFAFAIRAIHRPPALQ